METNLAELAEAVRGCTRCGLAQTRQQAVPGEGQPQARLMLIGQTASEADNWTGRNYSGPSGRILDLALERAGLSRAAVYLTNMLKCVPLAPRRADGVLDFRTPRAAELRTCRPWLEQEIALLQPRVIVLVGGPTAQALLGRDFKLAEQRGIWQRGPLGIATIATWQPAYLLRLKEWDRPKAVQGWHELVADMRAAAAHLEKV